MGVSNLMRLVQDNASAEIGEATVAQFRNKTIAIDANIYVYKCMAQRPMYAGRHIARMIRLAHWMRRRQIEPIFVFDGQTPLRAKQRELSNQRERKRRNIDRHQDVCQGVAVLESVARRCRHIEKLAKYAVLDALARDSIADALLFALEDSEATFLPRRLMKRCVDSMLRAQSAATASGSASASPAPLRPNAIAFQKLLRRITLPQRDFNWIDIDACVDNEEDKNTNGNDVDNLQEQQRLFATLEAICDAPVLQSAQKDECLASTTTLDASERLFAHEEMTKDILDSAVTFVALHCGERAPTHLVDAVNRCWRDLTRLHTSTSREEVVIPLLFARVTSVHHCAGQPCDADRCAATVHRHNRVVCVAPSDENVIMQMDTFLKLHASRLSSRAIADEARGSASTSADHSVSLKNLAAQMPDMVVSLAASTDATSLTAAAAAVEKRADGVVCAKRGESATKLLQNSDSDALRRQHEQRKQQSQQQRSHWLQSQPVVVTLRAGEQDKDVHDIAHYVNEFAEAQSGEAASNDAIDCRCGQGINLLQCIAEHQRLATNRYRPAAAETATDTRRRDLRAFRLAVRRALDAQGVFIADSALIDCVDDDDDDSQWLTDARFALLHREPQLHRSIQCSRKQCIVSLSEVAADCATLGGAVGRLKKMALSLESQTVRVNYDQVDEVKRALRLLGERVLEASGEAEQLCAQLCVNGAADAVMSDDTDVMPFGAATVLRRCHFEDNAGDQDSFAQLIDCRAVLRHWRFTRAQLLDLCILLGCDFCAGATDVSPQRLFELMRECGSLDGVLDRLPSHCTSAMLADQSKLDAARALFSAESDLNTIAAVAENEKKKKEKPNIEQLRAFLREKQCLRVVAEYLPRQSDTSDYSLASSRE